MVRIAKEDTYAMEPVGGGVTVRRLVKAGQQIPDQYDVEGDVEEVDAQASTPHYGGHVLTQPVAAVEAATDSEDDDADEPPAAKRPARRKGS